MERFKQRVDGSQLALESARKRVQDSDFETIDPKDLDLLASQYLDKPNLGGAPGFYPGGVLSSGDYRRYLKDMKFFANYFASQTDSLKEQITFSSREAFGTLAAVQQEAAGMAASVTEQELRIYGGWEQVHYNSFIRSEDMGLSGVKNWIVDWKTGTPFTSQNFADVIPGVGMTLPVAYTQQIPIIDAMIVGEQSDAGDEAPVVKTSVRKIFLPGEVFRYITRKKEFSGAGYRYARTHSDMTVQIELGGPVVINKLMLSSASQIPYEVQGISFLNEAAQDVQLNFTSSVVESLFTVLFEPVRTKYLRITLRQYATAASGEFTRRDERAAEINRLLKGAGFTTFLDETEDTLQGRLHDFSIENIEVYLNTYEGVGVFRALPMHVKGIVGIALERSLETIRGSGDYHIYGDDFTSPAGDVVQEAYLGLHLKDMQGRTLLQETVPLPDSTTTQTEFLPIVGPYCRVKLFPDLRAQMIKFEIDTAAVDGADLLITTTAAHGMIVTDVVGFYGPLEHELSGEYVVTAVPSTTTFKITPAVPAGMVITADQLPKSYCYVVADQPDPFTVYSDGSALTIGTDYEVSLDGGATWLTEFPMSGTYSNLIREPEAGKFLVKILSPSTSVLYWISYRYLRSQSLTKDGLVKLSGGTVILSDKLHNTKGTVTAILVNRSDSANQLTTSITKHYTLQVK